MKVLLAAPNGIFSQLNNRAPTNALYVLAAVLREHGHQVTILDHVSLRVEFDTGKSLADYQPYLDSHRFLKEEEVRFIDTLVNDHLFYPNLLELVNDADCVGISSNSLNWIYARTMAKSIKDFKPEIPIILGGNHPSIFPEYVLQTAPVDFVVRGEGEITLLELLETLKHHRPLRHVLGVSYRQGDNILHNPDRPAMTVGEIEKLAMPAYDLMPDNQFDVMGLETSRGCRYRCKFCSILNKGSWRGLSAHTVINKIRHAHQFIHKLRQNNSGKKEILFVDDNFSEDSQRVETILEGLIHMDNRAVEYSFEGRVSNILESRFPYLLDRVPLHRWLCGIESGYDQGLRRMGKGITIDQVKKASALICERGLAKRTKYTFILGFPWETKDDCLKTVDFMFYISSKYSISSQVTWYGFFPGSSIWDQRAMYGIPLGPETYDSHFWRSRTVFLRVSNKLSEQDIREILSQHHTHIMLAQLLLPEVNLSDILELD